MKKIVKIEYCNYCPYRFTANVGGTICDKTNQVLYREEGYFFIPKSCPLEDAE